MTDAEFWMLISLLDWDKSGDDDAVVDPVVEALSKRSIDDIRAFDEVLASKLHALDTKAHAENIGEEAFVEGKYFSVDWFLYARCVVVANGKELYESVLKSPASFPPDMEFESLLYIADEAYTRKTGDEYDHVTELSWETYSNEHGWKGVRNSEPVVAQPEEVVVPDAVPGESATSKSETFARLLVQDLRDTGIEVAEGILEARFNSPGHVMYQEELRDLTDEQKSKVKRLTAYTLDGAINRFLHALEADGSLFGDRVTHPNLGRSKKLSKSYFGVHGWLRRYSKYPQSE